MSSESRCGCFWAVPIRASQALTMQVIHDGVDIARPGKDFKQRGGPIHQSAVSGLACFRSPLKNRQPTIRCVHRAAAKRRPVTCASDPDARGCTDDRACSRTGPSAERAQTERSAPVDLSGYQSGRG